MTLRVNRKNRYACKLARHHTRHLASQTTRGRCFTHSKCATSLSGKNEKNTMKVSCSYLQVCTDACSRVANVKGLIVSFLMLTAKQVVHPFLCAVLQELRQSSKKSQDRSRGRRLWFRNKSDERDDQTIENIYIYKLSYIYSRSFSSILLSACGLFAALFWLCLIKLHFFVSLSEIFQCENILKRVVRKMDDQK